MESGQWMAEFLAKKNCRNDFFTNMVILFIWGSRFQEKRVPFCCRKRDLQSAGVSPPSNAVSLLLQRARKGRRNCCQKSSLGKTVEQTGPAKSCQWFSFLKFGASWHLHPAQWLISSPNSLSKALSANRSYWELRSEESAKCEFRKKHCELVACACIGRLKTN